MCRGGEVFHGVPGCVLEVLGAVADVELLGKERVGGEWDRDGHEDSGD
jgi:hypothetical protein